MDKIRLLLAISTDVPREGIKNVLESDPDIEMVLACSTGPQAIEGAIEHVPDIIVMDDDLLESIGFGSIANIHQKLPDTAIVVITLSMAITEFYDAFRSGVRGYLTKGLTIENLINAVKTVNAGGVVVPIQIAAEMVEKLSLLEEQKHTVRPDGSMRLGKREKAVLTLVAQGFTNSEIADTLVISGHTVKQHMRNIMGKLRAHTRQQAVVLAAENHLL